VFVFRGNLSRVNKYCLFINNPYGITVGDPPSEGNLIQEQLIDLVNYGVCETCFQ